MLKYHLLQPQYNKHHHAQFTHYLSLGSHDSPYSLKYITAFSIVTLNPKQSLPEFFDNQNIAVLPLKGTLKIDSVQISCDNQEKQQIFYNPKKLSNQSQNTAIFAFIRTKQTQIQNIAINLIRTKEQQTLQVTNSLVYLIEGKLSSEENESQVTIKNTITSERTIPALYSIEPIKVKLAPNSVYLQINDIL